MKYENCTFMSHDTKNHKQIFYLDKSELSGPDDSSLHDLKDVLARSSSDSVGLEISSATLEPGSQTSAL